MKLVIFSTLLAASLAAKLTSDYLPPNTASSAGGNGNFLATPISRNLQTAPSAAILKLNNENDGDGSYRYEFETENHIAQQESGSLKDADTLAARGSFSFQSPEGHVFTVNYVADENGFQAQGDHIPTAPPVPAEILKALEKNAADEAAGIIDDGQYRPDPSSERNVERSYLAPRNNGGYRY